MKMTGRKGICSLFVLTWASLPGCGDASDDEMQVIARGTDLVVYSDVADNPIPMSATAEGTAWYADGTLRLTLSVAGFPASREFGAHLHKLSCDDNKGGGHYQHTTAPNMDEVNTPPYANTSNEAWLDFMTKADGSAAAETTQSWLPRAGEAQSIIIHAMKTDVNGRAGDKLACLPMNLP